MGEDIPTTGFEGSKMIMEQNMGTERSKQKSRMDKQRKKLQILEEGLKVEIHLNSRKETLKNTKLENTNVTN